MGKLISIAAQKGGAGKSSLTVILASVLAYNHRKKVIVLDCDTRQKSIVDARETDKENVTLINTGEKNEEGQDLYTVKNTFLYKESQRIFKEEGIKPYPIQGLSLDADNVLGTLEKIYDQYDYIFIDLPGSIENNNYFSIIQNLDIVFIPLTVDSYVYKSNIKFAKVLHDNILVNKNMSLNHMFYFWNRYKDKRKAEYEETDAKMAQDAPYVKQMKTRILDTDAIMNPKMRSTIAAPFGGYEAYGNIMEWVNEAIECIDNCEEA